MPPSVQEPPQVVYVEVLGKAGAYGIGYERVLARWLAAGVAASFAVIREQQIATVAPYLHLTLATHGHHAAYVELGATLVHSKTPSPVMTWDGASDTGGGGFGSVGWQHAGKHTVERFALSVVAGEGGAAPWGGLVIGFKP